MNRFRSRILLVIPMCLLVLPAFLPGGTAHAATRMVSNCNDSGAGSLRGAVALAMSGDTIDLRSLTCSRIVLNGQVGIPQQDLRLLGPGRFALSIDGNAVGRVFQHTGGGTLYIDRMSITNGRVAMQGDNSKGGCIRSNGTVDLWRSRVHRCELYMDDYMNYNVLGGGIFALNVRLNYSSVFYNKTGIYGHGGGVFASKVALYRSQVYGNAVSGEGGGIHAGDATASYSLIQGNSANQGGGIYCQRLTLNKSTVSNNRGVLRDFLGGFIENEGGGLYVAGTAARSVIVDSTISGNRAYSNSAGAFLGEIAIYNSTITNNTENYPEGDPGSAGPPEQHGRGAVYAPQLRLESSILAGNQRLLGTPYDLAYGSTVTGSHNMISRLGELVSAPADTIVIADPRVAPLADNGGPTRTHMLLSDSPALDRGSNVLGREYDQRGPGFPRVKGPAADIGSIER